MTDYSPNQLAKLCAVIARGATTRDWSSNKAGKGPPIQEVQCLQFDGRLYFGCNHQEHDAVGAFFNAFGVHDEASLLLCLAYTDWLLKMSHSNRKDLNVIGDNAGYSEQEMHTFKLGGAQPCLLSWGQMAEAGALLSGDKPKDERTTHLVWFLRRLAGWENLGDRPKTGGSIACVTNTIGKAEVNLLKVPGDVHAELKLLAYFYHCVSASIGKYAYKSISLGGLKFTCKHCEGWIGHFGALLGKRHVSIDQAEHGARGSGGGAGSRPYATPLPVKDPKDDEEHRAVYINLLFNGKPNSDFTALDELKPTALA